MPLIYSKSRRLLGIHLSPHVIQFIELSKKGQRYCVENYAISDLSSHNKRAELAKPEEVLRQLCRRIKVTKRAVMAVPDACTLRKVMAVSVKLSAYDIEDVVALEVNKLLPQEIETLYYDFQWCQPASEESDIRDLVILAARKADVEQRMHWLQAAGFQVQAVDVVSQALYRVLKHTLTTVSSIIAWIFLEKSQLNLYIFHRESTLFAHTEPLNAQYESDISALLTHMQRALDMFQVAYPLYALSKAIVTSSGVVLDEVILSRFLNLEVKIIHPFETLALAKHIDKNALIKQANHLLIALGLALRL